MTWIPGMPNSAFDRTVTPARVRSQPRVMDQRAMTPQSTYGLGGFGNQLERPSLDYAQMGQPAASPQQAPDILSALGIEFPHDQPGFKGGFMGGIRDAAGGIGPAIVAAFGEGARTTAPWEYNNPIGKGAEAFNSYMGQQRQYNQENKRLERELELRAMSDPQIQMAYSKAYPGNSFQDRMALENEIEQSGKNLPTAIIRNQYRMGAADPTEAAKQFALDLARMNQSKYVTTSGSQTTASTPGMDTVTAAALLEALRQAGVNINVQPAVSSKGSTSSRVPGSSIGGAIRGAQNQIPRYDAKGNRIN